jgi:hypothetical protein
MRDRGRFEPYIENPAIGQLRRGNRISQEELLVLVVRNGADAWQVANLQQPAPQFVERVFGSFNIYYYCGTWYGLSKNDGSLDLVKVRNREYAHCYSAASHDKLLAVLPIRLHWLRLKMGALLRRVPFARRLKDKIKRFLRPVSRKQVQPTNRNPQLIEENYSGYNIVYYRGTWYAVDQYDGPFDPANVQNQANVGYYSAVSEDALHALIPAGPRWLRQIPLALWVLRRIYAGNPRKSCPRHDSAPHLVEENYYGFNIIYYRGAWYGLAQDEGAFEPSKLHRHQYRRCLTAVNADTVKMLVLRQRSLPRRMKDMAKKVLHLARRA